MNKFVFFGRSHFQYNDFDSMKLLLRDIIENTNVYYVEPKNSVAFKWLNLFGNYRYGKAWRRRFGIPLKKTMYKKYLQFAENLDKEDSIYFIFVRYEPWFMGKDGFLHYLREYYPNAKLVYLLINVNKYLNIDFDTFTPYFDRVITIDEGDAQTYNLEFHPFFYSAIPESDETLPESDCFFVGNAKQRLEEILSIFEYLENNGLHCDFHLVGVPDEKQRYSDRIEYNRPMDYSEVIYRTKKSKILLEIMQEGQTSGTLREHEAVVYGKELITNNAYIKERPFYNETYMQVIRDSRDIDLERLKKNRDSAIYSHREELSPVHFLKYLVEHERNER